MANRRIIIRRLARFLAAVLMLALCACVHTRQTTRFVNPDLPADRYADEMTKQQKILQTAEDATDQATACYNLALLYLSYRNPAKNYQTAQNYLIKSAALDKTIAEAYEVKNVLNMLNAIHHTSSGNDLERQRLNKMLKSSNDAVSKLDRNYRKCAEDNIRLIKENVDLKMSIERLKKLDLEIEQKRKTYK